MKLFTPNMNDEELDNLFRNAAEQYSEGYSEEGGQSRKAALWEKLQEKLDVPAHAARSKRRKWGYLIILLFIAGGIFTWLVYRPGKGERVATEQQARPALQSARKASPQNEEKVQDNTATMAAKGSRALPQNKKEVTNAGRHKTIQKKRPGATAVYSRAHALPGNGAGDSRMNDDKNLVSAEPAVPSGRLKKLPAIRVEISDIGFASVPDHILSFPLKSQDLFIGNPPSLPGTYATANTEKKDGSGAGEEISPKRPRQTGNILHWHFGLTAGPDWSSAAGKGWRTGVGGGLKLSYRLNSKWAVSTGVLLDKKLYDARPGDYNPPDNSWRNYDVKSIDANCTIIDVPLNIEYTLWNRPAHRIFVDGGLSSFWMHEEEYTYHYKTAAGDWDQWSKEMYNKNHHLFSVINFSPGYEHSWQHLSIQIAPYIKIPVSGIGYGKVKLYSTGIHFTLQYGLK